MENRSDKQPFVFEPIERQTIVAEITRQLLDYLKSGVVQPGQRLPAERVLAETLGVARSSLREALKTLTVLGLLEARLGDGTYLTKNASGLLPQMIEWGLLLGEKNTADLLEARKHIEITIAGLAAVRRTEQDLTELAELLDDMASYTDEIEAFIETDIAFHLKLADMTYNTTFKSIITSIQSLLRALIKVVLESRGDARYAFIEHEKIYKAIKAGDSAAASLAMEEHFIDLSALLTKASAEG